MVWGILAWLGTVVWRLVGILLVGVQRFLGWSGESWPGRGLGFTCVFSICLYTLIDVEGFLVLLFKLFVRVLRYVGN